MHNKYNVLESPPNQPPTQILVGWKIVFHEISPGAKNVVVSIFQSQYSILQSQCFSAFPLPCDLSYHHILLGCTCVQSQHRVPSFVTPWTVARQASRQEQWSGLSFPSPGNLPDPGIQPMSPMSPAFWQVSSCPLVPPGKPLICCLLLLLLLLLLSRFSRVWLCATP